MNWSDFVRRRKLNVPLWYKNSGFNDYHEFYQHLSTQGIGSIPTQEELNVLIGNVVSNAPTDSSDSRSDNKKPLKKGVSKKQKKSHTKKNKGRGKNDGESEPIIDSLYSK